MKRRLRRVQVSTDFFAEILKGTSESETNVPEDASFIRMYPSEGGSTYWVVLHSAQFRPLEEGETIPKMEVINEDSTRR